MKKLIITMILGLMCGISASAEQAFTLVSSEKKTVKASGLATLEKGQTMGRRDKTTLAFTDNDIRLVVTTGPEDDMLSYRIQGIRNPTLVVPSGATLRVLFINIDGDMKHDIRFGHGMGEFMTNPSIAETAGADKLAPMSAGTMNGQESVLKANKDGVYKYFCSVGSHAKDGMWGNIAVGVKPGADMQPPGKTEKMPNMPGMKPGEKMPQKKPGETSHMPAMKKDDDMANMPGMDHSDMQMKMPSVTNIGDPMERGASGTAWNPDSSPVFAKMKMLKGGGMLMLMGDMFVRYKEVGSTRNVSVAGKGSSAKADAPSMFMLMYSHPIGERSQFGFRSMVSLDPIIEQGFGYPLLYQSGEEFRGQPIHDRQHPHDLFSELAITFSHKFDDKRSFFLYAGYPGEPALGPPTFMHRVSGMNNPDAPIGHHWQDATHITFGVVTAGYSFGKVKVEASVFNGTEPDENRWNFDKPRLNSFSGRLLYNPTKNWAFQISHGYLKTPERAEPDVHILRKTTASASYNKKFDDERNWASTLIWGQNFANGERTNAVLFESNYDFAKNTVFGRFERVQKTGRDLVLAPALEHSIFWVGSLSAGYIRDLVQGKGIDVGLGGKATLDTNPSALNPYYGGTTHGGWQIFMRFRPSKAN